MQQYCLSHGRQRVLFEPLPPEFRQPTLPRHVRANRYVRVTFDSVNTMPSSQYVIVIENARRLWVTYYQRGFIPLPGLQKADGAE